MSHNYITSIKFVDADGIEKKDDLGNIVTIGSNIVMEAGINMEMEVEEDEIVLTAGSGLGTDNAVTKAKFDQIISGGGLFTGAPYWMSKINQAGTVDGAFFLTVDYCYHFGQFGNNIVPEGVRHTLSVYDTCPACVDCADYDELQTNVETVQTAIDSQLTSVENPEGMLDKYMELLETWNYIVHLKSWRYNAEAKGQEIHSSCKFINHTLDTIAAGLEMSMNFSGAPANTKAFVIDTAIQGSVTVTTTADGGGGGGPANTAKLTTTSTMAPGAGIRFYAGSLSPYYTDTDTRVTVNFSLTMPDGTGIGTHNTTFNTNKMVVINRSIWD